MTAGPRASASGERHMIARGIEAGWPRRLAARFTRARCGTYRTRLGEKARRPSSGNLLIASFCPRVIDSNPEHWETLLQFLSTSLGTVPGQFGLQSAPHQARNLKGQLAAAFSTANLELPPLRIPAMC